MPIKTSKGMSDNIKYFNFPIELLRGFMNDRRNSLTKIFVYSIYYHAENKLFSDDIEVRIEETLEYFDVENICVETILYEGAEMHSEFMGSPKVGINTEVFWNYRNSYKTPLEEITLLAYLALKSIIQNKAYCKITNLFWLSRMNGNARTLPSIENLSDEIRKYSTEYQLKKIKYELTENWNLIYYGRYTRGFYVSFKMELEDLVYQVEKKRKARKLKNHNQEKKAALQKALERLETEAQSN